MKLVSLFFLFPLSVSLSLYCVSELGVIQVYSLALSACHMVFLIMTFIFLFLEKKKKENYNYKEITTPEKNDRHIRKAAGSVTQAFIVSLYHYKIIEHLNE